MNFGSPMHLQVDCLLQKRVADGTPQRSVLGKTLSTLVSACRTAPAPHPIPHFEADFKDYGLMGAKETLDSRSRVCLIRTPSLGGGGMGRRELIFFSLLENQHRHVTGPSTRPCISSLTSDRPSSPTVPWAPACQDELKGSQRLFPPRAPDTEQAREDEGSVVLNSSLTYRPLGKNWKAHLSSIHLSSKLPPPTRFL